MLRIVSETAKNPLKLLILQRVTLFVIEEIGLISSETFGVMDTVMKYVMDNDLPFGGKLVIANGDPVQLEQIMGRPFWISTHLMMSFDIICLKKYVRMANDETLQDVLELMRSPTINEVGRSFITDAIEANCQFVSNWKDVSSDRMRVLTTKKAERAIIAEFLDEKRNDPNVRCVVSKSKDEILEGDRWKQCSGYRRRTLNNIALEREELVLFENAVMCFTYNNNEGAESFSQGGLCIVEDIPQNFDEKSKIKVVIVPAGENNFIQPRREWKRIQIGRREGVPILIGHGLFARRIQYPIRYYTVQNFHRVMGCTAHGGIASQLSSSSKEFRM
jgi:hypothetical protein